MNTQTKSNLIASIILALVPIGIFALVLPVVEVAAGVAIAAALIGLGVMDLNHVAYSSDIRGTQKPSARALRLFKF
ncbi:MAG: hypothetical protein OSB19_06565 [Opitutaceae bacterium]|jgi:hypothetical protein|nr:hypothetical protein [Opitutaceae bacterium]